jgi:hypothetical protein
MHGVQSLQDKHGVHLNVQRCCVLTGRALGRNQGPLAADLLQGRYSKEFSALMHAPVNANDKDTL